MSVRESFVATFGEQDAKTMEQAAEEHGNGINDANKGSDPFKWALCICIGYECFGRFAASHGFTASAEAIEEWIKDHGALDTHDGDVDYLAMFGGAYNKFMPSKSETV